MPIRRDASLIPLSHDHHHGLVRVFEIRQVLRAGDGLEAQAEVTRRFFETDLTPHFEAEEQVVLPAMRDAGAVADEVLAGVVDEHRRMRDMIAVLDGDAERLGAFADLLERHIRFEERELFAAYQEHVPAEAREAVEREVRRILDRPDDRPRDCAIPAASERSGAKRRRNA